MATVGKIGRRELVLLLIGRGSMREGLGGITRLQKLLFLLEKEEGVQEQADAFQFTAYKAGPYSSKLYDDLELLENLNLLRSEPTAVATEAEAAELEHLTFDDLIGPGKEPEEEPEMAADAYEERRFCLTEEGRRQVEKLLADNRLKPLVEKVDRIKQRYGKKSLDDLLYYVYKKYPAMTVESEIKEQVLGRRRRS